MHLEGCAMAVEASKWYLDAWHSILLLQYQLAFMNADVQLGAMPQHNQLH